MSTHPQRDSLRESWGLKELYDCPRTNWVELAKFNGWSKEKQRREQDGALVVIDGAIWAASDRPLLTPEDRRVAEIYSGNGEYIGLYSQQHSFATYLVTGSEKGEPQALSMVSSDVLYDATNSKEALQMANGSNINPTEDDLQKLLDGMDVGADPAANSAGTDLQNSGAFDGTNTPAGSGGDSQPQVGLSETVKAFLKKQEKADASLLHMFNFNNSEIMGWIVAEEARVEPTLRGVALEIGGKKQLEEDVSATVRETFETTGTAPLADLKKVFQINWRQTTPGKLEAMIIKMPIGGLVDYLNFQKPGKIEFDNTATTQTTRVVPYKAAFSFLNNYLRNGVKESAETHGAFKSVVKPEVTTKNVTENGITVTKARRKIVAVGRKTLVIPGNHLPIRTYEKVMLTDRITPEDAAKLNISAFYNLSQSKYGSKGDKLSHLHEDYVGNLQVSTVDGAPVIESVYITTDVGKREFPQVKPYYGDKTSPKLDEIYLPVKKLETNKNGELKARYIKYSAVDKATLENPELAKKTSLQSGEYADFIRAVGEDILNVDTLRGLTKERRTSKKVGTDIIAQLEMGIAEGTLNDPTIQLDTTPEELNEIQKTLYNISQQAVQV